MKTGIAEVRRDLGPLGFPMVPEAVRLLEKRIAGLDGGMLRRTSALAESQPGAKDSRTEISWISTERIDHEGDLILAAGMDDSVFALNPIVSFNHDYSIPPVGRSLWRKQSTRHGTRGILAQTHYPTRPAGLAPEKDWMPDLVLDLVRSGLAIGKSIGFIILESRPPTNRERETIPGGKSLRRIIEKWLLLEYSICWLPANPGAVLESGLASRDPQKRLLAKCERWLDLVMEGGG